MLQGLQEALWHMLILVVFFFLNTFTVSHGPITGHLPLPLLLAVVAVIVVLGTALACGSLSIGKMYLLYFVHLLTSPIHAP